MKVEQTCLCDHPIYVLILGKHYCAHCVHAWMKYFPGHIGGFEPAELAKEKA